jgi:plastocyanin domain-containing protein
MPRLLTALLLGLALAPAARADAPAKAPTVVELTVTSKGFEPASVKVPGGAPVKLIITRKTAATCAKEIVVAGYDINVKLPLNTPVEVTFTPKKAGEIRYACAMDMIKGVIVVE